MSALTAVEWLRNLALIWAGALIADHHFVYAMCLCAVAGVLEFVADEVRP